MEPRAKMLLVFVDESDTWDDLPLYEAIVQKLRQLDVSGATVQAGIMGFGSHMKVHRKGLFGISDERPILISVVEGEEKLRRVLPEIRPMVREGLLLLLDAEVIS